MIAHLFDMQDAANPMNGREVRSSIELRRLLDGVREREPFFVERVGETGSKLLLGIGVHACVQFSPANGAAPYLMAVAHEASTAEGEVDFLCGDTATPVPGRFLLPRPWSRLLRIS